MLCGALNELCQVSLAKSFPLSHLMASSPFPGQMAPSPGHDEVTYTTDSYVKRIQRRKFKEVL